MTKHLFLVGKKQALYDFLYPTPKKKKKKKKKNFLQKIL
jgi:hypothetical protein